MNEKNYVNPFDAVDWRWNKITALCEAGVRPKRADDKFIWRGWRFLNDLRSIKGSLDVYSVTLAHENIAGAYGWYNSVEQKKNILEALLICEDITVGDIAEYLGESPQTITAYEQLFFNILDKRDKKGFLCSKVLQPAIASELRDMAHPVYAWKIVAVFGGSKVVKACWEYKDHGDEANSFHYRSGISQLMKNFGMSNFFRPVNRYTAAEISDNVMRMVETELKRATSEGVGGAAGSRANIIHDILESVNFWIPEPDDKIMGHKESRLFELTSSATVVNEGVNREKSS